MSTIPVGTVVEGVVSGITHFGAFIELPGGLTGLVHISEVADAYVRDVKDFLKEQDRVKVKVLSVDERGKIGLSIKQANPKPRPTQQQRRYSSISFEDKLSRFLKESEERQQDVRKNSDGRRGGRR